MGNQGLVEALRQQISLEQLSNRKLRVDLDLAKARIEAMRGARDVKRYLLFAWKAEDNEAQGWNAYIGSFECISLATVAAQNHAMKHFVDSDWWLQVIDTVVGPKIYEEHHSAEEWWRTANDDDGA